MKFSTQEEYGLRCLLRIARDGNERGMTIPEISKAEGLSIHHTAKLLRILRINGFLESVRGQDGGYRLSKPPDKILVGDVINALGGKFYKDDFCTIHAADNKLCVVSLDCSLRMLWKNVQDAVDSVLHKYTLQDLISDKKTYEIDKYTEAYIVNQ